MSELMYSDAKLLRSLAPKEWRSTMEVVREYYGSWTARRENSLTTLLLGLRKRGLVDGHTRDLGYPLFWRRTEKGTQALEKVK